jgi:uncharacterized protein YlaN (UPF0358 family)
MSTTNTMLRWFPAFVLLVIGATSSFDAAANRWQRGQADVPAAPTNAEDSSVGNTVSELRRLMASGELTELRTTYNGNYGASLLFHANAMNYYVALFHEKEFWRVIRIDSSESAESLYKTFAEQTHQLAQVYLDTVRLQAGKAYNEKLVTLNERRLRGLQQEIDQQRQQSQQVSNAIQETKQQAATLSTDLSATTSQLHALDQQIKALQAQQVNPDLILPSTPPPRPAPVPAPAPALESPASSN